MIEPRRIPDASPALVRVTGWASIGAAVTFMPAARVQQATGWFPYDALTNGTIEAWLAATETVYGTAVAAVWGSLAGIVLFAIAGVGFRRLLRRSAALSTIGLAGYILGVPLAFAAFLLGLVVTWELVPAGGLDASAALLAEVLMRFMLTGDDLATFFIIGIGNGSFAVAAYRAGWLPRWLMVLGVAAAALWVTYLLSYFVPVLYVGVVGAPLALVWFFVTGVVLLRASRDASERTSNETTNRLSAA